MKSNFLTLGWKDLLKGFIVAILGALISGIYEAIQAGSIQFTWAFFQPIVLTAVGAGLAYLLKNWLTNSDGQFATKENK